MFSPSRTGRRRRIVGGNHPPLHPSRNRSLPGIVLSMSFSRSQVTRKPATASRHGIVAAQHRRAAEIGAEALAAGGNAVDAAVAVSFAIGVLEPWMSGPAGGGAAMLWHARSEEHPSEL